MAMYVSFRQTSWFCVYVFAFILLTAFLMFGVWLCFRYIPNNFVGIVEKLWSSRGSVPEGGKRELGVIGG